MIFLALLLLHPPEKMPVAEPAPVVDPLPQFPPLALAEHYYYFSAAHVSWLETRLPLEQDRKEWREYITQANYCHLRWQALHLARQPWWGGEEYDQANYWIDQLKDLLGEEDFKAGRMPPAAPFWYFRDVTK